MSESDLDRQLLWLGLCVALAFAALMVTALVTMDANLRGE